MTNKTNFIANFFNWIREVIESAETPFVLFAIVLLPILAPAVPATVTGIRLNTELGFHPILCTITAIVLEMMGYVGAIAFIKAISKRFRHQGSFLSVVLTGLAYAFYVSAMYLINVKLGQLSGDSAIVNQVFAILSFITVPTGLLAAEHINDRSEVEEKEKLRQEAREDRMKRFEIKHGANGSTERTEQKHRTPNEHRIGERSVANKANEIRSFVRQVQETEHRTPRVSEISNVLGVAKSYASDTLKVILNEQEQQ